MMRHQQKTEDKAEAVVIYGILSIARRAMSYVLTFMRSHDTSQQHHIHSHFSSSDYIAIAANCTNSWYCSVALDLKVNHNLLYRNSRVVLQSCSRNPPHLCRLGVHRCQIIQVSKKAYPLLLHHKSRCSKPTSTWRPHVNCSSTQWLPAGTPSPSHRPHFHKKQYNCTSLSHDSERTSMMWWCRAMVLVSVDQFRPNNIFTFSSKEYLVFFREHWTFPEITISGEKYPIMFFQNRAFLGKSRK